MPRAKRENRGSEPPKRHEWKKGQSGNPGGRPKNPPGMTLARVNSKGRLMESISKVLAMPRSECEILSKNQDVSCSDALMANVMMKGIKEGKCMHAQFFMSYTFGRPIEYDPADDAYLEKATAKAEGLPREVLVSVLKALANGNQPASVPAST